MDTWIGFDKVPTPEVHMETEKHLMQKSATLKM